MMFCDYDITKKCFLNGKSLGTKLMKKGIAEFGKIKNHASDSAEAVVLAKKLKNHITEHYYKCTDEILMGLGRMYAAGGDFTENIDKYAGEVKFKQERYFSVQLQYS